ncbi:diaminopimelate epimerase [Dermatobacter hominis]|uniref:diaminopimelate epimerase n=1 Tax=Dermatobacter hominis TaxID=2884263 RepID=UPI001D108E4F|nr:diaminopimelate epimerase [Dermatobacter hominis]UDY36816.1 diaminopimelate epimerase [Dermatobacter hominis]
MLRLTKFHGLGNDFLVAHWLDHVDAARPALTPDPEVARALCARHTGVGADGLIYALPPGGGDADVHMVLLNADGSEAEISGNGIRCLAQAVLRREGRGEGDVLVETAGGLRQLRTVKGDVDGELWTQVDMGEPTDGPTPSAAAQEFPALQRATVDIGNPHVVFLVEDPDAVDLTAVGPDLERSFAAGINVHVVAPTSDEDLELRVWERGVGITQACGSGAVAATVAAHRWGSVGPHVNVHMPGGVAVVDVDGPRALLTGPSTFVAEVVVP